MRNTLLLTFLLIVTLVAFPTTMSAGDWNRATTAIFNHPVQIPGQVLPPGIYVFKVADLSERNVVQIWNADESELIATLMAWPEYSRTTPAQSTFVFEKREKDQPVALKSWFYRGNSHGESFNYPEMPLKLSRESTK